MQDALRTGLSTVATFVPMLLLFLVILIVGRPGTAAAPPPTGTGSYGHRASPPPRRTTTAHRVPRPQTLVGPHPWAGEPRERFARPLTVRTLDDPRRSTRGDITRNARDLIHSLVFENQAGGRPRSRRWGPPVAAQLVPPFGVPKCLPPASVKAISMLRVAL